MKFILLPLLTVSIVTGEIITSPPITDWGDWGTLEPCPNETLVQAFQLKTEPYRGALVDDTAQNGVRLFCGNPLDPATVTVTSVQGSWGEWGRLYSCGSSGYITGFSLRVEAFGLVDDETATNNVRFFCSNMEDEGFIEGDGLTFGSWRDSAKCSQGNAVCGVQTQVQADRGALLDDTSMNNLGALCCPIHS